MGTEDEVYATRSTRDGGTWDWARGEQTDSPCKRAIFAYTEYGTEIEQAIRAREFLGMLEAAEQGRLIRGEKADVAPIYRHKNLPNFYELRFGKIKPIPGEALPVQFRLYFAEPPEVDGAILGLSFEKKAIEGLSDKQIQAAQNHSIDDAAATYTMWRAQHSS